MIARHKRMKWFFNLAPCIRGTGAKITYISDDFKELKVELPLNLRTRNIVGTIFGGSLYSAADPFYMLMLMEILGKDYVVWDKAAAIRFKRPGKTKLYYHFLFNDEQISDIKQNAEAQGEYTFDLPINAVDDQGQVYAEITKTMYVATKKYYQEKRESKPR